MKKNEKNITEAMLLNGYLYTMPGGLFYVSKLQDGEEVDWNYRKDIGDGYAPVCDRKNATMLYVEYRDEVIAMDRDCNTNPVLDRIAKDHAAEMRMIERECGMCKGEVDTSCGKVPCWME